MVCLDQASDRALRAGEVALELLAAAGRRGGGAAGCSVRSLDAAVNIAADELRVLEQLPDYPPDELVGADRAACADAPAEVPPAVPADAEVEEIRLLLVRV
jgi:hypothetical protein